jgi:hypothetical protein
MITTAIVLLALGGQHLPVNASFDYSGLPLLRTAEKVDVPFHTVTADIGGVKDGYVDVTTTTVYKNQTNSIVRATLIIPRRRYGDAQSGQPTFDIKATWNDAVLVLKPAADQGYKEVVGKTVKYASDLSTKVKLDPGATYALRVSYEVLLGRSGYEQKQRVTGYLFDGDKTIGQMNISYKYSDKSVFQLPEMHPNLGWQIGDKGAFVREVNYWPDNQLTYLSFYPGGF